MNFAVIILPLLLCSVLDNFVYQVAATPTAFEDRNVAAQKSLDTMALVRDGENTEAARKKRCEDGGCNDDGDSNIGPAEAYPSTDGNGNAMGGFNQGLKLCQCTCTQGTCKCTCGAANSESGNRGVGAISKPCPPGQYRGPNGRCQKPYNWNSWGG